MAYGYKSSNPVTIPGLWLTVFSATLAAVVLGGLILGLGLRLYIAWSIADTFKEPEKKLTR